jgi:hypothetical protein
MPHYPRWTKQEEQTLREHFPKLGLDGRTGPVTKSSLLFLLPNKSWDAILWKARQLGLERSFKEVHPPLNLRDRDLGYIAGMLDGEGCISFISTRRKGGYDYYYPYVSIANIDLNMLKWIQTVTGFGKIRRLNTQPKKEWRQRVPTYTWQASSFAEMYRFLTDLLPALKVKKRQAELVLEFLEIQSQKPRAKAIRDPKTGLFIRRIPIPHTQRQIEIYNEVRKLNSHLGKVLKRKNPTRNL